jgi:hypothetical protein
VGGLFYAGFFEPPLDAPAEVPVVEDVVLLTRTVAQGTEVPEVLAEDVTTIMESTETGSRRDAARRILAFEPSTLLPPWLEASAQLEAARSCETRLAALGRIRELGDRRARPAVDYLDTSPRRGCGRRGRYDCYACVRDSVAETLAVLSGLPSALPDQGVSADGAVDAAQTDDAAVMSTADAASTSP